MSTIFSKMTIDTSWINDLNIVELNSISRLIKTKEGELKEAEKQKEYPAEDIPSYYSDEIHDSPPSKVYEILLEEDIGSIKI